MKKINDGISSLKWSKQDNLLHITTPKANQGGCSKKTNSNDNNGSSLYVTPMSYNGLNSIHKLSPLGKNLVPKQTNEMETIQKIPARDEATERRRLRYAKL